MSENHAPSRTAQTPDTVLRRLDSPDVEFVEMDGEAVVYDTANNAVHLLDQIGTLLWLLLDGESTLRTTSHDLVDAFGRSPAELLRDVLKFSAHLEEIHLVERIR